MSLRWLIIFPLRRLKKLKSKLMLFCFALSVIASGMAKADPIIADNHTSLANVVLSSAAVGQMPEVVQGSPLALLSFHAGAMLSPRGGGLVGLDASMPSLSLGYGMKGRLDADVIFKANLGGIDTIVPVTFDQIFYSPSVAGGKKMYVGGGLGAILSGPAVFDGKLILGTEVSRNLGAELNFHFNKYDTLVTLFARLHM
jgi:hypothetical protein